MSTIEITLCICLVATIIVFARTQIAMGKRIDTLHEKVDYIGAIVSKDRRRTIKKDGAK